jgi:type II secretory ATPase GspE/PulE/Tfp pilus assembly ATPase PilB-like protein
MIGEIRDSATASLAVQAAQTGHLVLSTLHTRNARGALARLKNLGVDQESLESCLHSVSSQRLVRKLCQICKGAAQAQPPNTCQHCKGSGYLGRIGIHEVLGAAHLFNPSLSFISMSDAGMHHINEGLIDRASLVNEV